MPIRFSDLWRSAGTINRSSYCVIGLLGFVLKHNIDRIVASYGFQRPWGMFNYWVPLRNIARITDLQSSDARFLATMVALSLPFIWVGVTLTMKRLRSAGLPTELVAAFFLPFANLLFFLILCVLPERALTQHAPGIHAETMWVRIVPHSGLGSAAISLLLTVPFGFAMAVFGARVLANYGWGMFVALPFVLGFAAAAIYNVHQLRRLGPSVGVACVSVLLLGAALLGLAFEGIICLVMALPIALPLAAFGGFCGYQMQKWHRIERGSPAFLSLMLIVVPGVQLIEHATLPSPPHFVVRTAIDIQAPPEKVWKAVVAFSEIAPPKELIFRAGVAYPVRAEITGSGVGAERHCVFSTGAFVEPIQVWDEPRLLKFSVTQNPPPMQEWTPYSHVDPPHLHGFLVSDGGQFLLTPLPNGGTHLEGTTWYRHGLWPAQYWRVWSDAIIHRIHLRVLNHIRATAESRAETPPAGTAVSK